ncbi:MAG: class I SAM-dependent methyltransferase [Candidatus Thorarchaeota archaeon]
MSFPTTILKDSGASIIVDHLSEIEGGIILDVATGDGEFITSIAPILKRYDKFFGVDCCSEEITKAKKNTKNLPVEFKVIDAEKLPFENESFDTVMIANSLHHLKNVNHVLQEMFRVLKIGGNFILQEMFADGNQTEAQKADIISHAFNAEIDRELGIIHNPTFAKGKIIQYFNNIQLREYDMYLASRYIKCQMCEKYTLCDNPKNEEIVKSALKDVDDCLAKIKKLETYDDYKQRAEEIKEYIRENGSAGASFLFFIGQK